MSYTALYRKLRPKLFSDIQGQYHIVKTLQNQIINNHINHAYLFCGTHGTGKTSSAKLFAKAINCLHFENGEPCNKCEPCIQISNGSSLDVVEIDAASNNGVENIRDIVNEAKYPTILCNFKVYIIDEVHMLSTGAFNALLKTLEEPPKNVIFILATTDPQKIPTTILSRCQRFDFKRITVNIMVDTLKSYMKLENKLVDDEALFYIATLSDGSMRDALSLLDQCLSLYFDETITLNNVRELVGGIDNHSLDSFIFALHNNDSNSIISFINDIVINSKDITQFINECISYLRDITIIKSIANPSNTINMSLENINSIKKAYSNINDAFIINLVKEFSKILNDLKYSNNKKILFEIYCINLCTLEVKVDYNSIIKRLDSLEVNVKNPPTTIIKNVPSINVDNNKPITKKTTVTKSVPSDITKVFSEAKTIINKLSNIPLKESLLQCKPGFINENVLHIVAPCSTTKIIIDERLDDLLSLLEKTYKKSFDVVTITDEEYNKLHNDFYGADDTHIYTKLQNDINMDITPI